MPDAEFTIPQILRDPLIRQMLKADGMPLSDFALLLRETAVRTRNEPASSTAIAQPGPCDRRRPWLPGGIGDAPPMAELLTVQSAT
ncbi:hypothetical protein ACFFP0_08760 [Rhizobium puerariae]|uniref:Uncharacterized protein n=1 Tax=Rhizobium puerariae TaxID=1585791 RepID=A0ABV6AEF1_9HYPH